MPLRTESTPGVLSGALGTGSSFLHRSLDRSEGVEEIDATAPVRTQMRPFDGAIDPFLPMALFGSDDCLPR